MIDKKAECLCAAVLAAGLISGVNAQTAADIISRAGFSAGEVSFWVAEAGSRTPWMAINEKAMMEPASVMKIVTTGAALDILSPAWFTVTNFAAVDAPDALGRIRGASLVGGGDAHFVVENVWLMAERLRERGVREIVGDITIDRSRYDASVRVGDQAAFDGASTRPYNVGPDPAALNFKTISLTIAADGTVTAIPAVTPESGLVLPRRIRLIQGGCGDWKKGLKPVFDGKTLKFSGTYSASCGEKTLHYSAWDADTYATVLLRHVFSEAGIRWSGRAKEGRPFGQKVLASMRSAPLARTVNWINKFSNNAMARQLFLELGLTDERGETVPATLDRSRAVVARWLSGKGIDPAQVKIDNGSGLSRTARISARALGEVLCTIWTSSVMPEFAASLPSAGVDGTMKKRPPAIGSAHLKTGLLRRARSLAGYVTDRHGKRHVFVLLVNARQPDAAKALGDELVAWVADR